MNKLIDIANFAFLNDTMVLQSLLQSEGIEYFLKNENISVVLPGAGEVSGIILQVMDQDAEKAITLLKESDFRNYLNLEYQ
jgi:hypothetical protein